MTPAEPGSAPGAARVADWPRALVWALALIAAALALVILVIVATHAGANWFTDARDVEVRGARFEVVRGRGERRPDALVVRQAVENVAVVAATVQPFAAEDHPRIEWRVNAPQPPGEVGFIWRTRENPGRTYATRLAWSGSGIAPLHLGGDDDWRGTIVGVGLVMRGTLRGAVEVQGLTLPSGAAGATFGALLAQWSAYFPLKGYAVAFPFDRERTHFLPLAQVLAIAVAMALGAALFIVRRRHAPFDTRVAWLVFAAAWLILDARWHLNIGRAVAETRERFAGKTMEEKWLASDDAPLYVLARDVRSLLPSPPVRVMVLCDNPIASTRIAHFLYPHNVYAPLRTARKRDDGHRNAPDHAALRSGDHVLMFLYSVLAYDAAGQRIVWPDGHVIRATALLARSDTLLLRIE